MSGSIGDNVFRASGVIAAADAGRTGAVDWQTGSIKTATFTATTTEGYFCNTNGGVFTVNLPAGVAGSIVAISDYTRTFNTNNLTVAPNGSEKIGGVGGDAILSVNGQSATFVYVDGTEGWINTQETQTSQTGTPPFIVATGGTITTVCTNYKVHSFTGPGTFCVSNAGAAPGSNTIDYLVVAGGGGGTTEFAAGGAGGYRESPGAASGCYTVSPLGAAPAAALPVTATGYPVAVGAAGAGGVYPGPPTSGTKGSNSVFTGSSTITSTGGGNGISNCSGAPGGSGAGASAEAGTCAGAGNTPPVNPAQGTPGGGALSSGPNRGGGGGGGATAPGGDGPSSAGGTGGVGATTSITATPTAYAGGGGGGPNGAAPCGTGGAGPGGAGTTNKGGGGAAKGRPQGTGGAGGSGVVVIRYKFQ